MPESVFYAQSADAAFLANVGSFVSIVVPVPASFVSARFSTPEVEIVLPVDEGVVVTPAFSGPAIVQWLELDDGKRSID